MGKGYGKTIGEKSWILLQAVIYYGLMLDVLVIVIVAVIVVWLFSNWENF